MFPVILRFLFILVVVSLASLVMYKQWKKLLLTEDRKEEVEEAKIKIKNVEKLSEGVPQVNSKKLKKSRDKIQAFNKEGDKC